MDGHDFDNLTRRLATGVTRRRLAKGMFGGILGGLAGRRAAETEAARRLLGDACTRATECASFHYPNLGTQCGDVCCTPTLGASCAPNNDLADCNCCGSRHCGCPEAATCNAANVVCGGLLAECETAGDCVSGRCASSGGPKPNCCHDLGGFCKAGINSACCGTTGCGSGSGPGSDAVCGGIGAPCTDGGECVSGTCDAGICA